jgi:hypothetical protein
MLVLFIVLLVCALPGVLIPRFLDMLAREGRGAKRRL